jgi:hypothetical protein
MSAGACDLVHYRALIESALVHTGGTHTFEDVAALVASGDMRCWPAPHSIILTEIITYPRKRIGHVFLAAGNLAEIEAMTPVIIAWSKTQGCVGAQMWGRKGWERTFLTRTGWTPSLVLFGLDYGRQ